MQQRFLLVCSFSQGPHSVGEALDVRLKHRAARRHTVREQVASGSQAGVRLGCHTLGQPYRCRHSE